MTSWHALCLQLLPAVLQEFVSLIGIDATMRLVHRFGGTRVRIPLTATADHALAELIGMDQLVKLCDRFKGHRFDLPKAYAALLHIRNAKILAEYGPKSTRQLALEHGLTERQIWNIVANANTIKAASQAAREHQSQLFN